MADNEAFLGSIPKFLRRPAEPMPAEPMFMTPPAVSAPPARLVPDAVQAPDVAPGWRPGALALPPRRLPAMARPEPPAAAGGSEIVSLPARRTRPATGETAAPADFIAAARPDVEARFAGDADDPQDEGDDAAFQVTLPRSVIRQIRILAAQEGTTQRAIVLKALRLAGVTVPQGADIDRRILAARRRRHA